MSLLCAVAILVALGIRIGRTQLDNAGGGPGYSSDNRGGVDVVLASLDPDDLIETVGLEDGWLVPASVASMFDDELTGPSAGSLVRGARVEIPDGSSTLIVRDELDLLGLRFPDVSEPSENRGGLDAENWLLVPLSRFEAPDGLPGEEGENLSVPSSFPILIPDGAETVELLVWDEAATTVDVVFLPRFTGGDDPVFVGPAGPSTGNRPAIVPRAEWANLAWQFTTSGCSDGPSEAPRLQALVVHHTVTANDYRETDVPDLLRSILYSHTRLNGWCDIAYNFVVDRFGRIWEARTGSLEGNVIGGHARGFNTATLGVAMLGQHHAGARPTAAVPAPAVAQAIESIAAWKLLGAGVDPGGHTWLRNRASGGAQKLAGRGWHLVPTVLGHRDLGLTSCPGSHGMNLVAGLPGRLQPYRNRSIPYDWSGWVEHQHGPGFAVADARGGLRVAGAAVPWSQAPTASGNPVVAVGGTTAGGYVLAADGSLAGFGTAPEVAAPSLSGAAVDLVVADDGRSGWILAEDGSVRGFGGRADLAGASGAIEPVAFDLDPSGVGYVLERTGRLLPVGSAADAAVSIVGSDALDVAVSPTGGGWVLDSAGRLSSFGGAVEDRVSLGDGPSGSPAAVIADPTTGGGWVVDRSGQFHPFGDARFVLPVSTDAAAADVVDAAVVGTVVGAEFRASDDARYVEKLHQTFLDRSASDRELDLGVTELEQGERDDLVGTLVRSDVWVGAEIDQMYADVLGRPADPAGRSYWLGEVTAGLDLAELGTYFYGSDEYARAGGDRRGYVRNLYLALLGREPDSSGWEYWVGELTANRATPADVASGFYASIESRRQRAARLHSAIVGTPLDPAERDELAERLGRLGDLDFAIELAADSSFYELVVDGPPP